MKIKLIALVLALTMLSQTLQFGLATGTSGDPVPQTEENTVPMDDGTELGDKIPTPPVNPMDLIGTEAIEWCSYEDFLCDEMNRFWDDPQLAVGLTMKFNVNGYSNFTLHSDVEFISKTPYVFESEDYVFVDSGMLVPDGEEESISVVISDYVFLDVDENTDPDDIEGNLWFKVQAPEGETLPVVLEKNPYVLQAIYRDDAQSLISDPIFATFANDTVSIQRDTVAASRYEDFATSDLPKIFTVEGVNSSYGYFYDINEVDTWEGVTAGYRYVTEDSVILIPAEVALAYERLVSAEGTIQFNYILNNTSTDVISKIPLVLKDDIIAYSEELVRLESIEKTATVTYNGIPLNVTVKGKIPETGITLSVAPVGEFALTAEGFKFDEGEEIITALDIKLINDIDGTQWQPEKRYPIEVSIEMTPLGIEEGRVLTLRHKHEDKISKNDVFVVMDGKLTAVTGGFSIYVVSAVGNTTGDQLTGAITLNVGDERIFYCDLGNSYNGTKGTWMVTDVDGAIHYTVHDNVADSETIGHNQVRACWIKVVALKETTTPIELVYRGLTSQYYLQTQTYSLNITAPKAATGKKLLYIKDDVNTTGRIEAVVVDENGNEVSLDGAAFSWTRDDDHFIVPQAYDTDFKGVNIARDHGGLVEARMKDDNSGYRPTTYTVKVTLADGTELEDSYTVYYQSEIINSSFEFPVAADGTYNFFPNGYPELYWKTTAPGNGTDNITKDVEYGDVTKENVQDQDEADYGVPNAADGEQFAELNAEEFGTLYQDIITAPLEDIEWKFSHAARSQLGNTNSMFIVIGPTEQAQKIVGQDALDDLGAAAKTAARNLGDQQYNEFLAGRLGVEVEYSYGGGTAKYTVWYHTVSTSDNPKWSELKGTYEVPDNQYRTRVFFVTDTSVIQGTGNKNYGNMIDAAKTGQYKDYLIEYYVETYNPETHQTDISLVTTESGSALIYSSVELKKYIELVTQQFYLYKVLINDSDYPYDLSYYDSNPGDNQDEAWLYIEKYPGTAKDPLDNYSSEKYKGKDIVLQVYMRDTIVAIQKELVLPEEMTEEQKLTLMNNIGTYSATFKLSDSGTYSQTDNADITKRDPSGKYKGFVALGTDLVITPTPIKYTVEETSTTTLPGLELCKVVFKVQRYKQGQKINDELVVVSYEETHIDDTTTVIDTDPFELGGDIKIADVEVINTYREKETTIIYHAIGNGKIKSNKEGSVFEDAPTETLKYYSGKSIGCSVHKGNGATFVGWYKQDPKNPDNLIPVTAADGVVAADGSFKPNANILSADVVHFYAKFETCNIVIERENAEPGKTFVYEVTGPDKNGTGMITTYVTVTCGADGKGSTTIYEANKGQYTVRELESWSWRYPAGEPQTKTHPDNQNSITFTFNSNPSEDWLDGFSEPEKNVYGG